MTLSALNGAWADDPVVSSDTVQVRFQDAGYYGREGEGVTGTVTGRATDRAVLTPGATSGRGIIVDFSSQGSPATLNAVVATGSRGLVGGYITGSITFTDTTTGGVSVCPNVSVLIQPVPQPPIALALRAPHR